MQTLFNQPQPARSAVSWQPNAGIAKKLSERGYDTTSWTSDDPSAYADLGYPAKASGFSAAHYQSKTQVLSEQAKASLALLDGAYRNDQLGQEPAAPVQGEVLNEHLPFVTDLFAATRKSKLRVNVDSAVLKRAMAHAELSETLVLSPITTDETTAELIVIHPDVFDVEDASQDVLISANSSIEGEVSEPVEAANPEVEETIEVVENLVPAILGGIPPEEVEQREIEQFTKGLAQGKEEASVELAAAIEKAMAEGLEKGIQQGLEQGRAEGKEQGMSEGLELGLAQGVEQGKAQGIEEGRAQGDIEARDALTQEMSDQREVFENASKELLALIDDPKKFFEPLKRLALHIAEQVVIGELKTSSKAVERLVQRCLDELDHPVHGAVVLELNADDKARLQEHAGDFIKGMRLEAVPEMQPGSVRVFANDTVIEDLVEHRLDGLARALLVDVEAWREKSPLAKRILKIEEEEEDGDVHS